LLQVPMAGRQCSLSSGTLLRMHECGKINSTKQGRTSPMSKRRAWILVIAMLILLVMPWPAEAG